EQRPSRHCIRQLAEKAADLAEKGVIVVSVQSSGVDEKTLKEWVKDYKIPFPSGTTTAEAGGDYFTWGVKSLPWLILTDRQHVVQAEGFSFPELGEKLKGIN
ncbi:MAG: peroxiredoxin family protein, partial [Planctomycetota bacterium]